MSLDRSQYGGSLSTYDTPDQYLSCLTDDSAAHASRTPRVRIQEPGAKILDAPKNAPHRNRPRRRSSPNSKKGCTAPAKLATRRGEWWGANRLSLQCLRRDPDLEACSHNPTDGRSHQWITRPSTLPVSVPAVPLVMSKDTMQRPIISRGKIDLSHDGLNKIT
ncbi:hypothetical protein HNY73_011679, partial [Argiope bruennichi]